MSINDAVAVIGMSGRFPGADSVAEFWDNLCNGTESIKRLSDEELRNAGVPEQDIAAASYVKAAALLEDVDKFDAGFFKISPLEAEMMDPQIRLLLQCAWETLEDAGHARKDAQNIGVFAGAGGVTTNYFSNFVNLNQHFERTTASATHLGNDKDFLATYISYKLNLTGPSLTVQTACSTSLVALHQARQSLLAGECDMALAGGVTIRVPHAHGYHYKDGHIFSRSGRISSFDAGADGVVFGSGMGLVLLRRLSDALRDGDHVYAVVKGSAIGNDGKGKMSYAASSARGQMACVRAALRNAGVEAGSIGYVESHGTGTAMGDPEEVKALSAVFKEHTERKGFCALGAVKTNVGHLEAAAGIVGFIKAVLCVQRGVIPPTLHFSKPNPRIHFENTPFFVNAALQPWDAGAQPRRAAVNSLGVGGTNAFVIVEQHEAAAVAQAAPRPCVVPLSARTEASLREAVQRLAAFLARVQGTAQAPALADLAFTLQTGREAMAQRVAFVADGLQALAEALQRHLRGEAPAAPAEGAGQAWDDAAALAASWSTGAAVDWNLLLAQDQPRPRRASLPTYAFARDRYWMDGGHVVPAGQALHPLLHRNASELDEQRYSAVFSGEEFFLQDHQVRSAPQAGQASPAQKVLPGVAYLEMARAALELAAPLERGARLPQLRDVVWLQPLVVAGERQVNIALLPQDAAGQAQRRIDFEVFTRDELIHCQGSCVFDDAQPQAERVDLARLEASLQGAALDGAQLYAAFAHMGLEYGPAHRPITALARGQRQVLARMALAPALEAGHGEYVLHPALMDGALQAATTLLFEADALPAHPIVPFALASLRIEAPCPPRMLAWARFAADSHPGDKSARLDVDLLDEQGRVCVQLRGFAPRMLGRAATGSLLTTAQWQAAEAQAEAGAADVQAHVIACELPAGAHAARLGHKLLSWQGAEGASPAQRYADLALLCFEQAQALVRSKPQGRVLLQVVLPNGDGHAVFTGLAGLFKTLHMENPRLAGQLVFVDAGLDAEALARLLQGERARPQDTLVRHAGGRREVMGWQPLQQDEDAPVANPYKAGGVYLVTGGLGGLGRLFAQDILARSPQATVVLTGRAPAQAVSESAERRAQLQALRAGGARVEYRALDLEDAAQVQALVDALCSEFGQLNGVIHAAGMTADSFILKKSAADFRRVLAPKTLGTQHLDWATRGLDLDFLVLFSSLTSAVGNVGQADYAAANGFMDAFAAQRNQLVRAGQRRGLTLAIRWPLWQDGGMQLDAAAREMLHELTGIHPMQTATGLRLFHRSLALGLDQTLVTEGDLHAMQRLLGLQAAPAQPAAAAPATAAMAAPAADAGKGLAERAERYLCRQLSALLKLPAERVDARAALEDYGMDSLLALDLTRLLEKSFGALPKTLFFEYLTLAELAGYFAKEHAAALERLLGGTAAATAAAPAATGAAAAKTAGAARASLRGGGRRAGAAAAAAEGAGAAGGAPEPIAIVGLSGRYPASRDLHAFWNHLRDGRDCIVEVPAERWDWRDYYSEDRSRKGCHFSKWGGFIEGVDEFDARFFNISPLEAETMDPQERLFLQHAWMAMEDAGCTRAALQQLRPGEDLPAQVGVYAGVMYGEYQLLGAEASAQGRRMGFASNPASIANRVSYVLNLHGPSMVVDTMCSSSLTALHLACQDLRLGRTTLAIAGGVNVTIHPNKYLMLSAGQFISGDGHCQSFGEGGDGYIPGEGVGVAVLKRLSEAERDGNHIYGLITGSALSHGGKTNGYTVPNPQAQASAIRRALAEARVNPRHVSYLEAHGTGTKLGDPIEIAALSRVFREHTADSGFCLIGSAKSNIGHAEAAAGIAGLTKVLLQLRHGMVAPSLHSARLNPHIDFEASPFVVNQVLRPWEAPVVDGQRLPRIAGISSFGAGGSNAHLVVQEYVAPTAAAAQPVGGVEHVVPLSARTADQLRQKARDLIELLRDPARTPALDALAYTLQVGREAMDERLALLASSTEELSARLQAWLDGQAGEGVHQAQAKAHKDTLALLMQDADLDATVGKWIDAGQRPRLAELWTKGLELPWARLHAVRPALVSLPTYPFARQRHWVEVKPAAAGTPALPAAVALHPLLHRNTSDFEQQRYVASFRGDEFFLAGEGASRCLSEAACLEMARAAVALALPAGAATRVLELREVAWAQPGVALGQAPVAIALFDKQGEQVAFEIYLPAEGEGADTVLCQGRAAWTEAGAPVVLDLPGIAALGGAAPAPLQLPAALQAGQDAFVLHPALLQDALQAAAAVGGAQPHPLGLGALRIVAPVAARFAWSRAASAQPGTTDVDLCDEQGRVGVQIRGLRWQAAAQVAAQPAQAQPAVAAPAPAVAVAQVAVQAPAQAPAQVPVQAPVQVPTPMAAAPRQPVRMALDTVAAPLPQSPVPAKPAHSIVLAAPAALPAFEPAAVARSRVLLAPADALPTAAPRAGVQPGVSLFDHGEGVYAIRMEAPDGAAAADVVVDLVRALRVVERLPQAKALLLEGQAACFLAGGLDLHRDALAAGLYTAVAGFPVPVIAVAQGDALGAGMLLAAACDFMVLGEEARYAFSLPGEDLFPSAAEDFWVQRLGRAQAGSFLWQAPGATGAQLRAAGWSCPIVPGARMADVARALAADLARKPAPSLRLLKQHLGRHLAAALKALPVPEAAAAAVAESGAAVAASTSGLLALQPQGERVLLVKVLAQAQGCDAQALVDELGGVLGALGQDSPTRCVVLASELPGFLPGLTAGVLPALREALLGCARPVVAALDGDAVGLAYYAAQLCDAAVFAARGRYGAGALLADAVAAQDLAAALSLHLGDEAARALLLSDAELAGSELRDAHGAPHVADAADVVARALALAQALAAFPGAELAASKQRAAQALRAAADAAAEIATEADAGATAEAAAASAQPVALALQSTVISAVAHPDGVLEVHMADRQARNMFTPAFSDGLREVFEHVRGSAAVKAVVLTGYDNFFSCGGTPDTLLAIHEGRARFTDNTVFQLPLACPVPVVAAMQGHGIGAGWALGGFADCTLYADESRYFSPYMGYGFTPGAGSTLLFPQRIGHDLARETLLTAREYSGGELHERGLRHAVLPRERVLPAALELAHRMARLSRAQLVALKQRWAQALREALADTFERELAMHERTFVGQAETLARIQGRFGAEDAAAPVPAPAAAAVQAPPAQAPSQPVEHILESLRAMLAHELRMPLQEVGEDEPFVDLGLDSITGVTWIRRINDTYGTAIEAVKVYSYPTLAKLAVFVREEAGKAGTLAAPSPAPVAVAVAVAVAVPAPAPVQPAAPGAGQEAILESLRAMLAHELRMPLAEVGEDEPFVDLGLDSITGVTWIRRINDTYGTAIEAVKVYSYPTLAKLAVFVREEAEKAGTLQPAVAVQAAAPAAAPVAPAVAVAPATTGAAGAVVRLASWRGQGRRVAAAAAPGLQPIAVVGMAGRFAKARDLREFWDNIAQGRDCISEVPAPRWDMERFYQPGEAVPGKTYSRWMGALDGHDEFDAAFFNISPREARSMDPQQRVFLQACWHAIEHAGYNPKALAGSRCGVFAGSAASDYHRISQRELVSGQGFTGSAPSILAGRISYFLDLQGPSLSIDTACSSSLVAVASACDSLVLGGSDLALAGGVNVMAGPAMQIMTSQLGMLSPQGRCFSFDDRANGIVNGEGVGVVLLKRLADAQRDGDQVYAVVEGWGVNQDGRTNGITAPNAEAQTRLQQSVYERFGIDPAGIQLIEAHGTGTALGDPIEVSALKASFAAHTQRQDYCALGSIKSNIGHCLSAAGVSGLLKLLLALQHEQLPPTIHFERLNRHIALQGSPFYVNDRLREWKRDGQQPRRAAINAFGFSGTNAHVVLAEYRGAAPSAAAQGPVLVPLSARTAAQLRQQAQQLLDFLRSPDAAGVELQRLAYTLQAGREPMVERVAVVAGSLGELEQGLRAFVAAEDGQGSLPAGTLHRGQAGSGKDSLPALAKDPDFQAMVAKWIARRELARLADLWTKGLALDWAAFHAGATAPRRMGLPGYPFARDRFWLEPDAHGALPAAVPAATPAAVPVAAPVVVPVAAPAVAAAPAPAHKPAPAQAATRSLVPAAQVAVPLPVAPATPTRVALVQLSTPAAAPAAQPVAQPAASAVASAQASAAVLPLQQLQAELKASLAEVLFMQPSDVDVRKPFTEMGLDSIVGVEWVKSINKRYGTGLSATRVYDHPSVVALAAHVHECMGAVAAAAVAAVAAPAFAPVAPVVPVAPAVPVSAAVPAVPLQQLQAELKASLAEVLFMEPSDVDVRKPFTEMGLDSIVGVEWVKSINKRYGTELSATRVYDHPSVVALAAHVHECMGAAAAVAVAAVAPVLAPASLPVAPVAAAPAVAAAPRISREELQQQLRASLAQALYMQPSDVGVNRSFTELGLDSIIGVEWIKEINKSYGVQLSATRIYDYPSVSALAQHLLELLPATVAAVEAAVAAPAASASVAVAAAPGFRFDPARAQHCQALYFHCAEAEGDFDRDGEVAVRCALSPESNVCLREHVVFGQHLLPTDAYIELVVSALHSRFQAGGALRLRNVAIANPLLGVPGASTHVKVVFRRSEEGLQFFVKSSAWPDFRDDKLHMQGFVSVAQGGVQSRLGEGFAVEKVLGHGEIPTNAGTCYAPLQSLRLGERAALGDIRVAPHGLGFLANPFALYGGLCTVINHAAYLAQRRDGSCSDQFLPYRIADMTLPGALEGTDFRCYAQVRSLEQDAVEFYFEIVDPAGQPVAVVDSITLRRVSSQALQQQAPAAAAAAAPAPAAVAPQAAGRAVAGVARAPVEKVAIIGMSARYPGSPTVEDFWDNLQAGRDCVSEVGEDRWGDAREWFHPDPRHAHTSYSKWSGLIDEVDAFDALFFGISPAEAELIDPQQRIFLEESWKAIESAGYAPGALSNRGCGVYVGCGMGDYARVLAGAQQDTAGAAFMGTSTAILAGRISYFLNLKGPALAVDTACSSSLVALHLACESLRNGENELALAGGVNVLVTPLGHILTSQVGMPSRDGRCAAFDAAANGIVFSEGCGVLLLKPLSAALRDRDDILGVIEGSATNQDGKTNGITAPSSVSQERLLRQVYDKFGIDPRRISYVEAHGTGTALGDPIEVNALTAAFRRYTADKGFCALGSVKTNIGHCGFAAGVASIVKVLLSLKHRQLAPSIHYSQPNPHIDFEASPFFVNTRLRDWDSPQPRLACVSSFGFSGTNAHVVIGEHVAEPVAAAAVPGPFFVPLSAKTAEALQQQVRQLLAFVRRAGTALDMARLAYTLQVGRDAMEHRLALVVASAAELADKLQAVLDGKPAVAGVQRGRASVDEGVLSVLADEDMREVIERWIEQKKLSKVSELWARGMELDLGRLWGATPPRRMALPTYPFARERCWVKASAVRRRAPGHALAWLHPLLQRNTSDLGQQTYTSVFNGEEFFLSDHRVNGQPVLPAVAYLEMARAALVDALPEHPSSAQLELRHVAWAQPIVATQPRQVGIAVFAEEDGQLGFEVFSVGEGGGEEVLHCQGSCAAGLQPMTQTLDLAGLRAQMTRPVLDAGVLYPIFAAMGLQYGPAFQGIVAVHQGDGQLLVELKLPEAARAGGEFVLHPSLMDSALQGSITLIGDVVQAAGRPSLPFALESLRVFAACSERMVAWLRYAPGGRAAAPGLVKVDIDLCDPDGRVCVQMRGFSSRSAAGVVSIDEAVLDLVAQNRPLDRPIDRQALEQG